MSDGPHKSLKQKRHWKAPVRIVCNHAYALTDGEQKARVAIVRDFNEAPVKAVLAILLEGMKDRLMPDEIKMLSQLKKLERSTSTSTVKKELIDCARAALYEGFTHETSVHKVIEVAVQRWISRQRRSLDEHVRLNSKPQEVQESRRRLAVVFDALDVPSIVNELVASVKPAPEPEIADDSLDIDRPGPKIMPEAA